MAVGYLSCQLSILRYRDKKLALKDWDHGKFDYIPRKDSGAE